MTASGRAADEDRRVGLCARCEHARCITSSKGSEFWLCELAKLDEHFAKYPRLPVLHCSGFRAKAPPQTR